MRATWLFVILWAAALTSSTAWAQPRETGGGAGPTAEPALTKLPSLVQDVQAVYPPEAAAAGVEATVLLQIDVDAEGRVEAVEVLESAGGDYPFDDAAIAAARLFLFEPAEAGGVPVPVRITYRTRFVQAPPPAPAEAPEATAAPEAPVRAASVDNLQGTLLERGTRAPLRGAVVTVFRGVGEAAEGYEAESDEDGRFAFRELPAGTWGVRVDVDGTLPFETTETLQDGHVTDVTYYVERGGTNPFDVLVEGSVPRKEVVRRSVSRAELESVPGTFGDAVNVVQNLPGVARQEFGDGGVIVRGASPEDTGTFLAGTRVPFSQHFGGVRSVVPSGMIESITFYPGNAPTRFGRLIGGVLEISPKKLRPEALHGYADLNLFDASVYLEAPVTDDVAVAVGVRRSYIDVVLDAAFPDDAEISFDTAPVYTDAQALASWRPGPDHALRLFYFGSDDKLELLVKNPREDYIGNTSGAASITLALHHVGLYHDFTPPGAVRNHAQLAYLYVGQDQAFGGSILQLDSHSLNGRNTTTLRAADAVEIEIGVDGTVDTSHANVATEGRPPKEGQPENELYRDTTGLSFQDDVDTWAAGAWVEATLRPIDAVKLIPGLRVDRQPYTEELTVDPRFAARVELGDRVTLKGGVGRFHQSPAIDEVIETYGNPDLGSEAATHTSAGVEVTPWDTLSVDLTLFHNTLDHLATPSAGTRVKDGQTLAEVYNNAGEGRVNGLELLIKQGEVYGFSGWLSYTLSRAERRDGGAADFRLFDGDQTHILTLVGLYKLPWNLQVSGRFRYVTGNPTTPVIGSTYLSETDEYVPITGKTNSARVDAFHQLDLRLDKKWLFDTWALTTYLDVQNVYNQANVSGTTYSYDYTQSADSTGLPIIPSIGVKGEL